MRTVAEWIGGQNLTTTSSSRTRKVIKGKNHPSLPRLPLKIMNYWHMRTPPGWSTLFVSPLNSENEYFEPMSGVVETDKYFEFVNFPSFLKIDGDDRYNSSRLSCGSSHTFQERYGQEV